MASTEDSNAKTIEAVRAAVEALKKKYDPSSSEKRELFAEETNMLYVHVMLKKMYRDANRLKIFTIELPHSFREPRTTSVCLFTKNLSKEKHDPDVDKDARIFKDLLGIGKRVEGLSEIISWRQLCREYKTYEAKRKLSSAYDLFLVDERVISEINRNLGKSFIEQKKVPMVVNISTGDVNARVQKAIRSTVMQLKNTSNRCAAKIGRLDQSVEEVVANFEKVLEIMQRKLPGGWANVRSLHLATPKSPHLPVFVSFDSANLVKFPAPSRKRARPVEDELTTLNDEEEEEEEGEEGKKEKKGRLSRASKVRVFPDGRVELLDSEGKVIPDKTDRGKNKKKKKNRLHKRRKTAQIKQEEND